jgi:hypothetical protein
MEKRHYLALVFEDPSQDRLELFGTDLSKASETFDAFRQLGGPEGIVHASILVSTGRILKASAVQPKSWHKAQAEALRAPVVVPPVEPTPEEAAATLATTLLEQQAAIAAQLESIRASGLVPELLPVTAPAGAGAGEGNQSGSEGSDTPSTGTQAKATPVAGRGGKAPGVPSTSQLPLGAGG